jgi:hypothetical protein
MSVCARQSAGFCHDDIEHVTNHLAGQAHAAAKTARHVSMADALKISVLARTEDPGAGNVR